MSPLQRALLTVVHAEGLVTRSRAIWLLWREPVEASSRRKLRQILHQANARLRGRAIAAERDELVAGDGVLCDMDQVRAALEGGPLRPASRLLRAGFASVELPSVSGEYADWCDDFDAKITRALTHRAIAVWEEAAHDGRWTTARDAAECLYTLRPDDAASIVRVIEARARDGALGLAEAAYSSYREHLDGGGLPAASIEATIERVRTLQRIRSPRRAQQSVFVGRHDQRTSALEALDRIAAGNLAFVLVTGEAGIGKTRFLGEIEREAVLRGFRCLSAKPVELEQRIPLNPLLDALQGIDLRPHLEALGPPWCTVIEAQLPADLSGEMVVDLPTVQESSLPRRLLDSFSMLLEQIAVDQPTVLFIDDLHWADATTVAALQFFQRRWRKGSFGIIATARLDAIDRSGPTYRYISEREGLAVDRIGLDELTFDEARSLIESIGESGVPVEGVEKILEMAGPHPLYLTELTRDYLAGQLTFPHLPADQVPIPVSLREILNARIEHLTEGAKRVAGMLAVVHRPVPLATVAALCSAALDECTDYVEELVERRLVETDHDRVSISHDLFRGALYAGMSGPRRAISHQAVAAHLLREGGRAASGELAIHLHRAGQAKQAAHHGWVAGQKALESGAMAEAAYFFGLVTDSESDQTRRAHATAKHAQALHLNRNIDRANPALELAASRLRDVGASRLARRMEIRRVDGLAEVESTSTQELIERLAVLKRHGRNDEDWEGVALALDVELRLLGVAGEVEGVRDVVLQLREVVRKAPSDSKAIALGGIAVASQYGVPAEGVAAAAEAVRLTANAPADRRFQALNRLIICLIHLGKLHRPEHSSLIDEADALARVSGDLHERFSFESNLAVAALDSGDLDRAQVLLDRASRSLGSDATFARVNHACNIGELALAREDFGSAERAFNEMQKYASASTPKYSLDFARAGLGICAIERGALSLARRLEAELSVPPKLWYYDPTTVLSFRTRLMRRRGQHAEAISLLEQAAQSLRGRLTLAWLKIRLEQGRALYSAESPEAGAHVAESLAAAEALKLPHRQREFTRLLERIRQR